MSCSTFSYTFPSTFHAVITLSNNLLPNLYSK